MPQGLFESFKEFGLLGLLMAAIILITLQIINKLPNKKDDSYNELVRELTKTIVEHNTRASENHKAVLAAFTQHQAAVQKNHEKFLENQNATLQILVVQNEAIAGFKHVTEKIVTTLDKIHDKCIEHGLERK